MNNLDLENLYVKIDSRISLVASFTGDDSYIKIIKSCRLKPYSIFTKKYKPGTKFEDYWVDEFGNSLRFTGKQPRILLNDTGLQKNTAVSTDLFYGLSIGATAKNSKQVLVIHGKYFDKDLYAIAFYGQDEYLRVFLHNIKWNRISPLLLGLNTLRELFKSVDKRIIEIDKKLLDVVIPFDIEKCISASLPLKEDISSYFDKNIMQGI